MRSVCLSSSLLLVLGLGACSNPQPGPDKTVAGAVLGAGWGAGAGAVVGHQLSNTGDGAAVGVGFGAVSGALQGAGYDLVEGEQLELERKLASLKLETAAGSREINALQRRLDGQPGTATLAGVYQVFFDADATNLRSGSIANLEVLADSLRMNSQAVRINVVGHADDAGSVEYNNRLAEARARSVASYLGARGISMDQIVVKSFGAQRPLASNTTETGRQLNRRVDVFLGK